MQGHGRGVVFAGALGGQRCVRDYSSPANENTVRSALVLAKRFGTVFGERVLVAGLLCGGSGWKIDRV